MKNQEQPQDPNDLRAKAEEKLSALPWKSPNKTLVSTEESQRLLQELQVHQIELELQNEELKDARSNLEQALEKYSDLYDFAPLGYFTVTKEKIITEANLAGAKLLEIDRSNLVNRRLDVFISEEDRPVFNEFLDKVFSSQIQETCEVKLQSQGKKPIYVEMGAIAFSSGHASRLALMDITERKQAEQDRLIAKKLESSCVMAAGIAHDFNNLLTIVLLNIELAQSHPTAKEMDLYLDEARKAALTSKSLTQKLLALSQGEMLNQKPAFISTVIKDAVHAVFEGSKASYDLDMGKNLWPVEVAGEQLSQVLQNLALNAIDSMPHGGMVNITVKNIVLKNKEKPSLAAGNYVEICLKDQGTGISDDVMSKVFDPYFSTKQRGTKKGMGLGLTICRTIIQRNHGTISVNSELGKGSTFCIFFPASQKDTHAIIQENSEELEPALKISPQCRILVMEDEEMIGKVVRITLERSGHEVELAVNGETAVKKYENALKEGRTFDLVILDLFTPEGMGGLKTMEALLQIDRGVQAVAMSGYANDPVIQDHKKHGFISALIKPFKTQDLIQLVSAVTKNSKIK
jgi:two-component system, cell cycle sensor histidine kinase and response regulator CckA